LAHRTTIAFLIFLNIGGFLLAHPDVSPTTLDPIAKTLCRRVSDYYMALVEATQLLRTFEINNGE
jgi:hypothetical protein